MAKNSRKYSRKCEVVLAGTAAFIILVLGVANAEAAKRKAPSVRVQTGEHQDFSRMVIQLPHEAKWKVDRADCRARLTLSEAVAWPAKELNETRIKRLSDFRVADGGRSLAFGHPCGAAPLIRQEGRILIVDVGNPGAMPGKPAATAGKPSALPEAQRSDPAAVPAVASVQPPPQAAAPVTAEAQPRPVSPSAAVRSEPAALPASAATAPARVAPPAPAKVAAASAAVPMAGSGIGLLDLAAWHGTGDYASHLRELRGVTEMAVGVARTDAFLTLARFHLAWAMPEEGRAALAAASEAAGTSMTAEQRHQSRVLADAFRILDGTGRNAGNLFVTTRPISSPDHLVWRTVAKAGMGAADLREVRGELPNVLGRLLTYPEELHVRLLSMLADAAAEAGDAASLERVAGQLALLDTARAGDRRVDYFQARIAELRGRDDDALNHYDTAAAPVPGGAGGVYARRAQLRAVELRLGRSMIDGEQAVSRLEELRFAWRGDDVEVATLRRLGELYLRLGHTDLALYMVGAVARRFADKPAGADAAAALGGLVGSLLDRVEAEKEKSEAAVLHARFGDLIERVDEGGRLRRRIAHLLAETGLTIEAERLLAGMLGGASGATRAELGADLAELQMRAERPVEALDTLVGSAEPKLPPDLAARRALLHATALIANGQPMAAINALRGASGEAADRLRANAIYVAGEWGPAASAYAQLVRQEKSTAEPDDVARLALAAFRAGDAAALEEAVAHRDRLTGTAWDGLADALLSALQTPGDATVTTASVMQQLAAAEKLSGFAARWNGAAGAVPPAPMTVTTR